jgi:hypothetical protein
MGPTAAAVAVIAAASVASSVRTSQPHSAFSVSSSAALMSLAITRAPSRAKASAVARPMPWPAAVRKAVLPASRWLMGSPVIAGAARGERR